MPVRLRMTSCQSASDVIAIHGVDKDLLSSFKKLELEQADLAAFKADVSGALLGEKIAKRYGWKKGQSVTVQELEGVSFNISGIFKGRGSMEDFLILVGRRFLQEADNRQGMSHYVLVKTKDGADQATVCRAIEALPLTISVTAQPEEAQLTTILDQLADLVKMSRGVIMIIVFVVLIAVGNAISMATRDRYREFGILRTLGFPRGAIMFMVLGEGMALAVLGALLGCGAVQLMASLHLVKAVATCAVTVDFMMGANQWIVTFILVLAAACAGSIMPAWTASRIDIVSALRPQE